MQDLREKTLSISGMVIKILSEQGENYTCRNLTTRETLTMNKEIIENAIKLGKAEVIEHQDEQ